MYLDTIFHLFVFNLSALAKHPKVISNVKSTAELLIVISDALCLWLFLSSLPLCILVSLTKAAYVFSSRQIRFNLSPGLMSTFYTRTLLMCATKLLHPAQTHLDFMEKSALGHKV